MDVCNRQGVDFEWTSLRCSLDMLYHAYMLLIKWKLAILTWVATTVGDGGLLQTSC